MPKTKRWYFVSALCLILAGVWQVWEGWGSLRTGIQTEGIEALGAGAFLVFLGLCCIGVALGFVRLREGRP
jgi:DMSO/TMAO reductase YedYZ heme-binding membrane subunit